MEITLTPETLYKLDKSMLVDIVLEKEEQLRQYKDKLLTKKQAAQELNVSVSTIEDRLRKGKLRAIKDSDSPYGLLRIPMSEIVRFRTCQR